MGLQPFWRSHMEVSYCTSGFGAVIQDDLYIILVNACFTVRWPWCLCDVSSYMRKATWNLLGALSWEQILRYNNSPPYVAARWLPQQIPSLNSFGYIPLHFELFHMRHDQGEWVGCREYWFWVTGLKRWQILMFCIVFNLQSIFTSSQPDVRLRWGLDQNVAF